MTTAICIASGPSLTAEDVNYCRGKGKVYVINNSFKLAPWADVLYACDGRWWKVYHEEVAEKFSGECWTVDVNAADDFGLNLIGSLNDTYWSTLNNAVSLCGNSGHQALNLACVQGASKVILLGYDMKPRADGVRHWHGDHVQDLLQTNPVEYVNWCDNFRKALPMIEAEVINCTRETALDAFPRADLRDVL